ncbi:MAG TPA: peptidylprolyl isomerase [Myxococcota bacterium]|nr:peptidylprolyl isomerase [Myxococcota bacterium]HRY94710.1 peptidylprolyl isomerase [Myxococcota bacterium]HSA21300.1 peptidylprolyl isomerase [Myxococcota bacterium]
MSSRAPSIRGLLLGLLALAIPGCERELPSPVADLPPLAGLTPDPARSPSGGPGGLPEVFRASQILVRYQGALESARFLPRTRAGALERARTLATLARSQQHTFGALVRQFSDDTRTSMQAGDLGPLARGELHPDLEQALAGLAPGQVSDPVESPWGFHVLQRTEAGLVQAGDLLIAYDGAQRYSPRSPRTREEAAALAEAIHRRLRAGGSFVDEVVAHSDLPDFDRGGLLSPFAPGTVHPKFEELALALPAEGGLGEVVETPNGFHIVIRLPLRRVRCRLLGLEVRQAPELPADRHRTLEQAMERAHELRAQALAPGADFAGLVARESEHPSRARGGLQVFEGRGRYHPALEQAAFALAEGELSPPIEAEGMVYLLRRVPFQPEP